MRAVIEAIARWSLLNTIAFGKVALRLFLPSQEYWPSAPTTQ